jgi:hypothetical protein
MHPEQLQIRLLVEPMLTVSSNRGMVTGAGPDQVDQALTASVESAHADACAGPLGDAFFALVVPPGPAWIRSQNESAPVISLLKPNPAHNAVLVEPVRPERQPKLLLSHNGQNGVYVNGVPAGRFMLLKEKDVLRLDGAHLLHVCIYNQPLFGPASAALAGKECPVCRVPLMAASRCYICPSCGAAMHFEESDEGLQCAQLRAQSGCPACQRPVVLIPGYSYFPEVSSE